MQIEGKRILVDGDYGGGQSLLAQRASASTRFILVDKGKPNNYLIASHNSSRFEEETKTKKCIVVVWAEIIRN
jgi:hypothetical protein